MNLRIDGQELRFRVSKEELESLCAGVTLEHRTDLPSGKHFKARVVPDEGGTGMFLTYENECASLHVGTGAASAFYDSLPSREGITAEQRISQNQSLTLMLEVDIRTQKRKKK